MATAIRHDRECRDDDQPTESTEDSNPDVVQFDEGEAPTEAIHQRMDRISPTDQEIGDVPGL